MDLKPAMNVREAGREGGGEEKTHDVDPYAQTVLPEEHYVGEFDDIPLEWPTVPYSHKICRCCYNAGVFETIHNREEPVPGPCPCILKSLSPIISDKDGSHTLGRMGWRVCLTMAFFPLALPFRACAQHKKIKDVYPVETEGYKRCLLSRIKAALCFPSSLAKHAMFLSERRQAGELRYSWQTRETWVTRQPSSALFKVLVIGDRAVGKTALVRALCGQGFEPTYTVDTTVHLKGRSYFRHGYPPAVLEIWDVPASPKEITARQDVLSGATCAVLVFDPDESSSFRVTKQWHSSILKAYSGAAEMWKCEGSRPPQFVMVGTKIDVSPVSQCTFLEDARVWSNEHGCPLLFCTSFTGEGVNSLLRQIVSTCFEQHPPPDVHLC